MARFSRKRVRHLFARVSRARSAVSCGASSDGIVDRRFGKDNMTTSNEYSQTGKKRRSTAIAAVAAALFFAVGTSHTHGQTAALPSAKPSGPKFDVASIRPSRRDRKSTRLNSSHLGI